MNKYTLSEYKKALEDCGLLQKSEFFGHENDIVDYLTYDSRNVSDGTLFICKGIHFKEEYLTESIKNGAKFYVSEKEYPSAKNTPYLIVNDMRKAMAVLANKYDNEPWKELCVTAVGGTKGKTTTACFLRSIADSYLKSLYGDNALSGFISTIAICDGKNEIPSRRTTPEAVELQHILRRCADNDAKRVSMEVSSQGLKYDRVAGMRFDMSVFLNISEDHISPNEHKDFNDYLNSKMKMFDISDKTVINLDIDYREQVLASARNAGEFFTFSLKDDTADFFAYDIKKVGKDTAFRIKSKYFDEEFKISIPGFFNVENAAAAIAASYESGIPISAIKKGIYLAKAEGRMELYPSKDESLICVVDYAHNGFSMEKLFSSLKTEYPDRKLITVFGMAGGKALGRRKEAGETAGKYADKIILTADDPANEKIEDICMQVAEHIPASVPYEIIPEREQAVAHAILTSEKPAVIAVTGKGSETDQAVGDGYVKCLSDAEAVKKYLKIYDE